MGGLLFIGFIILIILIAWVSDMDDQEYRREMQAAGADALIAFWDGKSPGTENMISIMRKAGKPVQVIHVGDVIDAAPKDPWYKNFAKEIPEAIIEQILLAEDLPSDPFAQACFRAGFVHAMEIIASISDDKSKGLLDG